MENDRERSLWEFRTLARALADHVAEVVERVGVAEAVVAPQLESLAEELLRLGVGAVLEVVEADTDERREVLGVRGGPEPLEGSDAVRAAAPAPHVEVGQQELRLGHVLRGRRLGPAKLHLVVARHVAAAPVAELREHELRRREARVRRLLEQGEADARVRRRAVARRVLRQIGVAQVAQGLVVLVVELGLLRGLLRLDAQDEVRHGPRRPTGGRGDLGGLATKAAQHRKNTTAS